MDVTADREAERKGWRKAEVLTENSFQQKL